MRKIFVLLFLVCMFIPCMVFGSGNQEKNSSQGKSNTAVQEKKVDSRIPQFVRDYIRKTPEDAFVGVGAASHATLNSRMTYSESRARAQISRQLVTVVSNMVRDYSAESEVDPSAVISFQEQITVALSRSTLQGATIVDADEDDKGNFWTVIMLNKTAAAREINQAVAAAKLQVPKMNSFDAEARMNAEMEKAFGTEIGYADRE
jgi:hypothetical protein